MSTPTLALAEALPRLPMPYGLPPVVADEVAFETEPLAADLVLSHLSPDQGVLALELLDPRLAPPAELEEVLSWTRRYLVTLLEVLTGLRPTQQLLRWSSADIYTGVMRRAALQARLRARTGAGAHTARVASLRASFPCDGVAEVGAVLREGGRVRAVALRVEKCTDRTGERWRVTALELG